MERAFGASSLRLPAPCMVPGGAQAGQVFCPLVRASGHQGEACAQTGAHSVSGTGAVGQLCPEGCVHACVCSGVLVCVCACTYVLVHTHVCSCVHMCACVCSCVHVGECFFFLPQGASHQCRVFLLPPPPSPCSFFTTSDICLLMAVLPPTPPCPHLWQRVYVAILLGGCQLGVQVHPPTAAQSGWVREAGPLPLDTHLSFPLICVTEELLCAGLLWVLGSIPGSAEP